MSKEAQQQHLTGAIAVATEALQHLERGSVVAVKYDEGAAMEVEGPARVTFKLEVEALDLPLRNITRTQEKFLPDDPRSPSAMRLPEEVFARADELKHTMAAHPSPAKTVPLDETTIRGILMGVFLGSTTLTIDRAVKKLLDTQDGGR